MQGSIELCRATNEMGFLACTVATSNTCFRILRMHTINTQCVSQLVIVSRAGTEVFHKRTLASSTRLCLEDDFHAIR